MSGAIGTNGDLEAELRAASSRTGVPISSARSMPDEVKRRAALADRESPGDRLGVLFVNCLTFRQTLVIFIGQGDGTYLNALSTAGAFCQVYKTRLLVDGSREVPRNAFKTQEFGMG